MYIKISNKKIQVKELKSFKERFKSIKFVLEPIDYGLLFRNKRIIFTHLFCQKVDLCFLDSDDNIIKLYSNVRSEKIKLCLNAHSVLILPIDSCSKMSIGNNIKIKN